MKRKLPDWGIEVKKTLIDRDMTITQLAKEIGRSRVLVSSVINGSVISPKAQETICNYLEVDMSKEDQQQACNQ